MVQIHCTTHQQIDALWRLLIHVPDSDFLPCDVYLDGTFRYRVIRHDGEQTTTLLEGQPGYSCQRP